jgi:hypothetical protein
MFFRVRVTSTSLSQGLLGGLDELVAGENQTSELLTVAHNNRMSFSTVFGSACTTVGQHDGVKVLATGLGHGLVNDCICQPDSIMTCSICRLTAQTASSVLSPAKSKVVNPLASKKFSNSLPMFIH